VLYISSEILSRRSKIVILILTALLGGGLLYYAKFDEDQNSKTSKIISEFELGKTLKCGNLEVNSSAFNYQFATQSFIAKKGYENIASRVIPLKDCVLK